MGTVAEAIPALEVQQSDDKKTDRLLQVAQVLKDLEVAKVDALKTIAHGQSELALLGHISKHLNGLDAETLDLNKIQHLLMGTGFMALTDTYNIKDAERIAGPDGVKLFQDTLATLGVEAI